MLDQLSAKWLESPCNGVVATPNIDRLRERGVTFSNAFTSNPICMAARPTMATGLTSRGHGVLTNGYSLDPAHPTFMRALQTGGTRTGAFGKIHFHPHFAGVHPDYTPFGFDVVRNTEDPRAGEWLDWLGEVHPRFYDAALATIWPTEIPELKSYGRSGENLSERILKNRDTFSFATPSFPVHPRGCYTLPFPEAVSQTAWITDHAIDFIRSTPADQPLYAHISYVQPHSPFCPPEEYMDRVNRDRIPSPCPIEWVDDANGPECFRYSEGAHTEIPDDWRETRSYYFADIAHLDSKLGMVLDCLVKTGRLDTTYLFFLADHGELLLDHGFTGKAQRHYDACVRIPFILSGPGLSCGNTRDEFVQLEDVYPTVLEMAHLPIPEAKVMGPYLTEQPELLYGRSIVSLAEGGDAAQWRDSVYIESYNNIRTATPVSWARTVRTAEWRYTLYPKGSGEQLFHISVDPDEQNNLADDPDCVDIRNQMRDRLLEHVILQDYPHSTRDLFAIGVH